MSSDLSWNDATSRLVQAVDAHDLKAARRALMEGALIGAVRTAPDDPVPQGPMYRVLLGYADEQQGQWLIDLSMVHLMLMHGAPMTLSTGVSLMGLAVASQAHNAAMVVPLLAAHGDQVTPSIFLGRLLTPPVAATGPYQSAPDEGLLMLDTLWQHTASDVRAHLERASLPTLVKHAPHGRLNEHGFAMARWLLDHGADLKTVTPSPHRGLGAVQLHEEDWHRLQCRPEAVTLKEAEGNVVPFRRLRPR
jgi:hypothetical protein